MDVLEQLGVGVDVVVTSPVDDAWIADQVRVLVGAQGRGLGLGPVIVLGGSLPRLRRLEVALRAGLSRVHAVRSDAGDVRTLGEPPGEVDVVALEQRWLMLLTVPRARAWVVLDDVQLTGELVQVSGLREARHYAPTVCLCAPDRVTDALAALHLYRPVFVSEPRTPQGAMGDPLRVENPSPSAEAALVFETLRAWRAGVARKAGIPAYRVFSNKQLQDMITLNPRTREEFLALPGVGEKKWEQFGDDLLAQLSVAG